MVAVSAFATVNARSAPALEPTACVQPMVPTVTTATIESAPIAANRRPMVQRMAPIPCRLRVDNPLQR
jgi:hypothetical protein